MMKEKFNDYISNQCNPTVEALISDSNQGDTIVSFGILVNKE